MSTKGKRLKNYTKKDLESDQKLIQKQSDRIKFLKEENKKLQKVNKKLSDSELELESKYGNVDDIYYEQQKAINELMKLIK